MKKVKKSVVLLSTVVFGLAMASCGGNNTEVTPSTSTSEVTPSTDEVTPNESVGLEFELSSDEGSYYVSNLGTCTDTDVVIPASYNGLPVIGIGDSAFEDCSSLTSITIPSSVTSIGQDAFYCCRELTSITIPSSVTSIGDYAFRGCDSLTSIVVDSNNSVYDSRNNCNAIIETSTNKLISGCKNTIIPSSVTSIGDSAFEDCSSLTSITIPSSVTSIGDSAFEDCSSLTSITIPSSVTSIGKNAFNGCSSLTSITIPSSVTSIEGGAFYFCSSLTSITIPSSVTSIRNYAFRGCDSLTSIVVDSNNSVYDSRNNCNAIIETSTNKLISGCKNTIIPSSVTSIGDSAFEDCSSLTSITIPSSVTSIGKFTFSGCNSLTSITIPSSVTSIGNYAFYNCSSLTSINYAGTMEQWNNIYNTNQGIQSGVVVTCTDGTITIS